jgi:hypothetical protein
MSNGDILELSLRFDAIKDQVRLLDERCEDPALTSFILAIEALAQSGFEKCVRMCGRPSADADL